MSDNPSLQAQFDQCRTCVIIPTYNNATTLAAVIEDVLRFTNNIIVVNDGSTDSAGAVLTTFPHLEVISYPDNRGKGTALQKGFKKAGEAGYDHAITIDADGQHFAGDLVHFIEKLNSTTGAIIMGARNMDQSTVPGGSSFGNRFSNFWFKVETGINLPDTQTGYRLYPVSLLKDMHFYTAKYEFEIEVLVRAAWKGIPITSVPISVYYPPAEARISHFRPFRDFFRISVLNTILVLIAFLYIKPRDFFRWLSRGENWKVFIKNQLLNTNEPAHVKALSVGFGIFMGIVPIWGFQLVTAIFLSVLFRLNKMLVIIAANISIPPMIPLIIFLSFKTGAIWMKDGGGDLLFSKDLSFESIKVNFQQYFYGGITLAVIAGILSALVTWVLLLFFRKKIPGVV